MKFELTRSQKIIDGIMTAIVALVGTFVVLSLVDLRWQVVVSIATTVVATWFRRRNPGLALGIIWVGVLVQLTSDIWMVPTNALIPVFVYATGRYAQGRVRWFGLGSAIVGGILAGVFTSWRTYSVETAAPSMSSTIIYALVFSVAAMFLFVLSWTIGVLVRTNERAREEGYLRIIAENEQVSAQGEIASLEERNRIARDMHDVVAHSLAVIIAQSDGARYVHRDNPAGLSDTLETVATTAREALVDVRLLLTELRHSQGEGPQPRIADLPVLFDQMRETGLDVVVETVGAARALPTGQEMAVYRIVQESLTNALRHGDRDSPVAVDFAWGMTGLTVAVRNRVGTLPMAPSASGGHGLAGMRERASLAGGSVDIHRPGPGASEPFEVIVRLPFTNAPGWTETGSIAALPERPAAEAG